MCETCWKNRKFSSPANLFSSGHHFPPNHSIQVGDLSRTLCWKQLVSGDLIDAGSSISAQTHSSLTPWPLQAFLSLTAGKACLYHLLSPIHFPACCHGGLSKRKFNPFLEIFQGFQITYTVKSQIPKMHGRFFMVQPLLPSQPVTAPLHHRWLPGILDSPSDLYATAHVWSFNTWPTNPSEKLPPTLCPWLYTYLNNGTYCKCLVPGNLPLRGQGVHLTHFSSPSTQPST